MMTAFRPVCDDIRSFVTQRLAAENKDGIKIIYACESGSRGWGYAAQDSDYDVRFLFEADVEPVNGDLNLGIFNHGNAVMDLTGWSVKKAERLALKSNAVLLEWLNSPIVYVGEDRQDSLYRSAASIADLSALSYHYRSMAALYVKEYTSQVAPAKKTLYAIRSAAALAFIHEYQIAPPMNIQELLASGVFNDDVVREIDQLIGSYAVSDEKAVTAVSDGIYHSIAHSILGKYQKYPSYEAQDEIDFNLNY